MVGYCVLFEVDNLNFFLGKLSYKLSKSDIFPFSYVSKVPMKRKFVQYFLGRIAKIT